MSEVTYRKVMCGKRTTYVPILEAMEDECVQTYGDLTNQQLITMAGTLGVVVMYSLERNVKMTPLIERRIKSYRLATHELVKGTGHHIDDELRDHVMRSWDLAMIIGEHGTDMAEKFIKFLERESAATA